MQNNEGYAPSPSEFQAAVAAVTAACDGLDGFLDGIISAPALCDFTAQRLVGSDLTCSGASNCTFSQQAADVIDKIWQGPRTPEGEFLWYGLPKGANFSALAPNLANSSEPQPFLISDSWFRGFLAKDLNFSTANVSYTEFTGQRLLPDMCKHTAFADWPPLQISSSRATYSTIQLSETLVRIFVLSRIMVAK